jgi:hypothetical protein
MAGLELRRQFGSFAVAVRSAATRGPNGLGGAVLDVINPAAETLLRITMRRVGDIGLYLPHLGTGLANKPVASAPVVLGTGQSRRYRATNDDEFKAMAGPRVGTAGSANRLRAPHVDWQQLHGTSALGPRVAACSVALPRSNVRALRSKKSHKRYPVSVGSTPCAMSDYSGEQLHARLFTSPSAKWSPLSSISAVRIFKCVPAGADFDY